MKIRQTKSAQTWLSWAAAAWAPLRACSLHWWEFIGAFGCIGDGQFAQVVSIRNKRLHGKKLDKAEQEFVRNNPDLVTLPKHKLTSAEEEFFKSLGV